MEVLVNYIGNLKLAGRLIHQNLTIFPVLAAISGEPGYLNMREALHQGVLRVTENTLGEPTERYSLINASKQPVLIVQGEEIPGSDGQMAFNISFVTPPKSETAIPAEVKAPAPVQEIPLLGAKLEPGRAPSLFACPADPVAESVRQFRLIECQVGAIFAVEGQIVGFEAFGHPDIWAEQSHRLLKQYALLSLSQKSGNSPKVQNNAYIQWVVKEFGNKSAVDLELISTAVFIDRNLVGCGIKATADEIADQIKEVKPRYSLADITPIVEDLERKGYRAASAHMKPPNVKGRA